MSPEREKGVTKMAVNESSPHAEGIEEYMNKGVKDVITEHPELEAILDDYDIGCGSCMVGTCLLKDIVDVHGLPPETEQSMMARITKAIYPDAEVEIPEDTGETQIERTFTYSPPVQILVDEHKLIKRLIALIPFIAKSLDLATEEGRQLVLEGVDFIKTYADSFHHAKEEDLLFKYFDEDSEIVSAFNEDHVNARNHVKNIVEGVAEQDSERVGEHLTAYMELLKGHIQREDEILYPWMDRGISYEQEADLAKAFNEVDDKFGDVNEKYEAYIKRLENIQC
jgi:hemerythrin-like domain-containing protein